MDLKFITVRGAFEWLSYPPQNVTFSLLMLPVNFDPPSKQTIEEIFRNIKNRQKAFKNTALMPFINTWCLNYNLPSPLSMAMTVLQFYKRKKKMREKNYLIKLPRAEIRSQNIIVWYFVIILMITILWPKYDEIISSADISFVKRKTSKIKN